MSDKMAMVSMKSLAPMGRAMTVAAMIAMLAGCGIIGGKKGGPKTPVVGNRVSILSNEQGVEVDPALADVPVTLPAHGPTGFTRGEAVSVLSAHDHAGRVRRRHHRDPRQLGQAGGDRIGESRPKINGPDTVSARA